MKNCSNCSAELKFGNTLLFGMGKLKDGGVLCTECSAKAGSSLVLKKYTLEEVQAIIAQKLQAKEEKAQQAMAAMSPEQLKKALLKQEEKDQKRAAMDARMEEIKAESAEKKKTLEEIKAHIKTLPIDNISSFFGRKEINELPNILAPDERVDNIVQGKYGDGLGILVSTNRRLVFIDKGLIFGLKVENFPLDKVSSIQYETGLMFGKIKIHTSGNTALIENIDKASARQFAEFVRAKLSAPKDQPQPQPQAQPQPAGPDILEQLEKLGRLKDSGILSEQEFAEQKSKLLAKL